RATRLAQFYTRCDKIFQGVVRFGWSTASYDRAGEPTSEKVEVHLTAAELEAALGAFRGAIAQRPPAGATTPRGKRGTPPAPRGGGRGGRGLPPRRPRSARRRYPPRKWRAAAP